MADSSAQEMEQENKIDLIPMFNRLLKQFYRTWLFGILFLCLCAGAGAMYAHYTYSPQYEAKASFVVSVGNSSGSSVSRYYSSVTTEQLAATFPYILTSGALNKVVANDLGVSSVPGTITAEALGETNLFQIKVVASDAQTAYDILQSVVENYPTVAKYVIGNTSLKKLEDSGVPVSPMNSYDYRGYILKFVLVGLLLYLIFLVFLMVNNRTISDRDELQQFVNAPCLAGIPFVRGKQRSSKKQQKRFLAGEEDLPDGYMEAVEDFQIRFSRTMEKRGWKTVLVTSALASEGKTSVSCGLAMHLADKGAKVLLIDCDLRSPSVAATLGFPEWGEEVGLIDYLKGSDNLTNLLHTYNGKPLYVIPGGKASSHAASLYTNGKLENLIEAYRDKVDYIIVDTPPCTFMHDTALVAPYVDTGILVVRQDGAPVSRIMAGAEVLAQAELPLAGCVLNGISTGPGHYGYGYGYYGYGYGYGYGRYYGYGHYGHYGS